MSDAEDDKVVSLEAVREQRYAAELVWKCECESKRFFLTRDGPKCVYCDKLAKGWMDNG